MTDLRKAAETALEALEQAKDMVNDWGAYASHYFQTKNDLHGDVDKIQTQITELRQALAQPEQNIGVLNMPVNVPVTPPKNEWQVLTDEDYPAIRDGDSSFYAGVKWAEAKLKEKNT